MGGDLRHTTQTLKSMWPLALVNGIEAPVVLGEDENKRFLALDPQNGQLWQIEMGDVYAAVNVSPASVYWGLELEESQQLRLAANAAIKTFARYRARGKHFPILPEGIVSGFPQARTRIEQHRREFPSVDTIFLSLTFAIGTVQTPIDVAERSFQCFTDLYKRAGRQLPPVDDFIHCFSGLQNAKSEMYQQASEFAPVIHSAIRRSGLSDSNLRRYLALGTKLPRGLGLSKLSFVLALLGHDCICIDARLLGVLLSKPDQAKWMKRIGKRDGLISEQALDHYEALEKAFLRGNPHYDRSDPLGRARAQWMSWEAVGGEAATHSVWLSVLQ